MRERGVVKSYIYTSGYQKKIDYVLTGWVERRIPKLEKGGMTIN